MSDEKYGIYNLNPHSLDHDIYVDPRAFVGWDSGIMLDFFKQIAEQMLGERGAKIFMNGTPAIIVNETSTEKMSRLQLMEIPEKRPEIIDELIKLFRHNLRQQAVLGYVT